MKDIIRQIEDRNVDPARKQFGEFAIGDTVEVKVKITEGDKTRIQGFSGTVIARKHGGTREMFTVRRLVDGEGVERTWPLHSPHVVGVEVKRHGVVSRAKLFYLRDRVGKATRLRERQEEEEVKSTEAAAETGTKRRRGAKAKAERRARAAEAAKNAPKKPKKKKKAKAEAGAEAPQA